MSFCKNCGAPLPEGSTFCSACGEPVKNVNPHTQRVQNTYNHPQAKEDLADISISKVMAVLSYLGLLVLIPYFFAKKSKFARFHTRQGSMLFVISLGNGVISTIIHALLRMFAPPHIINGMIIPNMIALVISSLLSIISIIILVLIIIGIINACKGRYKELPIIGKFTFLDSLFK